MANGRRKENLISRLMVDNEKVHSFDEIAKEVEEFYVHLYKKEYYERPIIENLFSSTIPSDWARDIEKPFNEEEVCNAVFGTDEAKAPGPDGFSMLFYQECWESLKKDLMKVFKEIFERGALNKSMRSTFLVLVPKKETTMGLGDFQPINLITNLYKIISKVLSAKLKGVMEHVVSSTQSAFIQGQQIMDNIMIANECVDGRMRDRLPGVVCKLDMEKAYDRVTWDLLF